MLFKTIAFLLLLFFLVKVISRLFLPSRPKKKSGAHVFYQVFRNMQKQQRQQQNEKSEQPGKNRFDEIEEAEFEEIPEEKSPSDQQ